MSEKDKYIAKMIKKGHSDKRALQFWNQKQVDVFEDIDDMDDDTFGGQPGRARAEDDNGKALFEFNPEDGTKRFGTKNRVRSKNILVEGQNQPITVFAHGQTQGIPVVRQLGSKVRYLKESR